MPSVTYHGPTNPSPRPGEAHVIIYGYVPSLGLALAGMVLWLVVGAVQLWYTSRKRGFRAFHLLISVGSLMEFGGYLARAFSHYRPFLVNAFVVQYFLIVVAPVLFSAAIYITIRYIQRGFPSSERLFVIPSKWILAFFVSIDVVTTIIQVAGAALIGVSESKLAEGKSAPITPAKANNILLAGLAIQTFSFCCFLSVICIALYRAHTGSRSRSVSAAEDRSLRVFLWLVTLTSVLILMRTTFRLAETAQGFFGSIEGNEVLYGVFESLPVIIAILIFTAFPPSSFVSLTKDIPLVESYDGQGEPNTGRRFGRSGAEKPSSR